MIKLQNKISNEEMDEIISDVKKDFPEDPALRQVHISQRIISRLSKNSGKSHLEIIKSLQK
jgi:hypothetical protein